MATVTQIASGRWVADAATVWDTGLVPAAGDIVLSGGGYTLTVDDDTNVLAAIYRGGGAAALTIDATKTLATTGLVNLKAFIAGTGTISCGGSLQFEPSCVFSSAVNIVMTGTGSIDDDSNSPGGANLEINTAGTVTLATDVYCVDFLVTAGTIAEATFVVHATGDIAQISCTHGGSLEVYCDGTGTAAWPGGASLTRALRKAHLAETGNTTTLVGNLQSQEIILRGGTLTGAFILSSLITPSSENTFWQQCLGCPSPIVETVQWQLFNNLTTATVDFADVSVSDELRVTSKTGTQGTITVLGDLNIDSKLLCIESGGNGDVNTLVVNSALIAGAVVLGATGAVDKSGVLTVNGTASIASLVDGNAANLANAFNFGPGSHVEFSGLADFNNIAVTASTDMPPEIVCTAGGKVTNCEPDNEIALFGDANVNDTPGTNNANITNFVNNQSHPGSLKTLGIGGGRLQ